MNTIPLNATAESCLKSVLRVLSGMWPGRLVVRILTLHLRGRYHSLDIVLM